MAAESLYLRSQTFTAGYRLAEDLCRRTPRQRHAPRAHPTSGEVAPRPDGRRGRCSSCEFGQDPPALSAERHQYVERLRPRALSTPIRGVALRRQHGDPSGAASVEGDLYVRDAGSSNAWLESYDGSAYRGSACWRRIGRRRRAGWSAAVVGHREAPRSSTRAVRRSTVTHGSR